MINFNHYNFKLLLPTALTMILLTACGGGGGGSDGSGNGGFTTSNTNTKPQDSDPGSSSSSVATSSSIADQTQSSKSSTSNSSKSSSSKSSISSKGASSSKPASNTPDTTPPVAPSEFYVASAFSDAIFLSWSKTSDNVAVVAYKLYRDGIQIADLEEIENFYADYNVAAGKSYNYGLSVGDAAGNWSTIVSLTTVTPTQGQASSRASSSSSKASNSASSKSSNSSSSSKSSSSAAVVIGVSLQWQRPVYRENGSDFFEHELGGYELHYKPIGNSSFTVVKISPTMTTHILSNVASNAEFEIAAFDTNNLYSRFITLKPL